MRFNYAPLYITGVLATASIICSIACSSPTSETNNPVNPSIDNFEVCQTVKTISKSYLCEGEGAVFADSLKIYSTVQASVQWPDKLGGKNIKTLQDSLINAVYADSSATTIDQTLSALANRPEGIESFKMQPVDSVPTSTPAMVYQRMTSASVISFNTDYIVYAINTYAYSGGAHGISESHYVNYDINSGKVINFENAFIPNYENKLLDAIKSSLMQQFSVTNLEGLQNRGIFTDQLFVSHNIYLSGYDMVFHYNPYDIGPYALGSIDVRVPYYTIEELLTPDVRQLLSKPTF